LAALERYDPASDSWTTKADLPTGRSGLFMEAINGRLYAAGGFNGNFSDVNEIYDPAADSWTTGAPLPTARAFGMSVEYSNEMYVIGGYNFSPGRASTAVDKYNPTTNTWTSLTAMPFPVAYGVAEVIGTKIYVMFGGVSFAAKTNSDEETIEQFNQGILQYDLVGNTWKIMDAAFSGAAASTTLSAAAAAAASALFVPSSSQFGNYGFVTVNRGGASQETVRFVAFDSLTGGMVLEAPLANAHAAGETVHLVTLPENRIAPISYVSGTKIYAFGGKSFLGSTSSAPPLIRSTNASFDSSLTPPTNNFSTATTPLMNVPRFRSGHAAIGSTLYVAGGSADKSNWLNGLESFDGSSFTVRDKMLNSKHSPAVAATGGFVYAAGGGGSGHAPGWLKMVVEADPEDVRADGKTTTSISITATDDSGDSPPDGTNFLTRGLIYVSLSEEDKEKQQEARAKLSGDDLDNKQAQRVSILPVLFSSNDLSMAGGIAATTMLARSEDTVNEVEQLFNFVKGTESSVTQEELKQKFTEKPSQATTKIGDNRDLYNVAIEVTVQDDFYFGQTDTDGAIAEISETGLSQGGFSSNPPSAQQGLSASVRFFSDITSLPDVNVVTDEPVGATDAKDLLDQIKDREIPFGSSPHFDGLEEGASLRNEIPPALPLLPPANIMVSASDNDENSSQSSPQDVVDQANAVSGTARFPVFVNSFVVTDPISLSARRSRTDVADLEFISSSTGGNSFSIVDPTYVQFVIDRIKTSAPASMGSGTILLTHETDGYLMAISYVVGNMIAGNSAEMRLSHSLDGYTFTTLPDVIQPNATFSLGTPVRVRFVKYEITLRSKSFNSPVLQSVSINLIEPAVQYVYTLPQDVPGQISELAAVVNHRLPEGGTAEVGLSHGDNVNFDGYADITQPAVAERGTIVAVNRSFDALIEGQSIRDVLETDDFYVYRSKSGPWPQDSIALVFVNEISVLDSDFLAFPEDGLIVFRKRLGLPDKVALEVQLPARFRVGIRLTNPTLQAGVLDSFAYSWGSTEDPSGGRPNRPPKAVNLFISPSPALPGGPLNANYTFVDPDGDEEDKDKTALTWFVNNAPVPELTNKRKITNSDILAKRPDSRALIVKDQEWFFTVRPNDGRAFGALSVSPIVTIANIAPTATNIRIKSSNEDPQKFTSSDTLTAEFDFFDKDNDSQDKTIFSWVVNGLEAKTGNDATLSSGETDANGIKFLAPGNTVRVDVTPYDGQDFGITLSSQTITIVATPPEVSDVSILPTSPSAASSLRLTYKFTSTDDRQDQSRIAWFRNGERVSELDNTKNVASSLLTPGHKWFATVTPFDGEVEGEAIKSNEVAIKY
jgi:N-acetylneuraminic acid mutarotase